MKPNQFNWRLFILNRRYLLYAVGAFLLSLVLIFQAIMPLAQGILETNAALSQQNKMVEQLTQKAARLRELESDNNFENQQLVNSVLPSKKPVLELLTGLNVAAGKSGVSFTDLAVSPGQIATSSTETNAIAQLKKRSSRSSEQYDSLSVQLTAEGTFDQVQIFLKEVENLAPFTTVTDLNLSIRRRRVGIVQSDDFVSAEMMLASHYYTQSLKSALASQLPEITAEHEQVLTQITTFTYPTLHDQREVVSQGVFDLFGINTTQLLQKVENE